MSPDPNEASWDQLNMDLLKANREVQEAAKEQRKTERELRQIIATDSVSLRQCLNEISKVSTTAARALCDKLKQRLKGI